MMRGSVVVDVVVVVVVGINDRTLEKGRDHSETSRP